MKQLYLGGKYNCTLLTKDDIPYLLQSEAFGELRLIRVSETMYVTKEVLELNAHVVLFVQDGKMTVELGSELEVPDLTFQPLCGMDVRMLGICLSCMIESALKVEGQKVLIARTIVPGKRTEDEMMARLEIAGNVEADLEEIGVEAKTKVYNPTEFIYFVLAKDIKFWRVGKVGDRGFGIEKVDVIPHTQYLWIKSNCYEFVAKDGYFRLEPWKRSESC
jgi:hypothetical protein